MSPITRRTALHVLAWSAAHLVSTAPAGASLARGLTLEELVRACSVGVVGIPLASECHFEETRGQRAIVTDTRVRVDEALTDGSSPSGELMVRTLGGVVGNLGERVEGQARLVLGERSVLFLSSSPLGVEFITGMAQGHYALRAGLRGELLLAASRNLPRLLRTENTAVARLAGRELSEARAWIRGISR